MRVPDMHATFISFEFSDLSKLSASKKFVFTDWSVFDRFCHLFCIGSFAVFEWIFLFHKIPVAVANVQYHDNDCLHTEYENFLLCTNSLMKSTLSLVWRKFSRMKREGWYDEIKKMKKPKLGDAPVGHPSIFQEDSSVPKASPSLSTTYQVIYNETIF